ncbi:MAG TPA: heavy metal-binding domain-containing protein [Candidatus Udaeobacter sp.]|nr:heavy metal-binding domain-containing protein [Candidatus Udaeobacter sp.]
MRKHISAIIASALVLLVTTMVIAQHSDHEHQIEQDQEHEHEKTQKYTCVMHPEVITDRPGNCPKCAMKLVPVKEDQRRTSNSDKSRAGVPHSTSKVGAMESPPVASHPLRDHNRPHHEHDHPASVAAATSGAEGEHKHEMHMEMHSTVDLVDPMSREGSGTSWLPDSSPMYGRMFMFDDNMLMLHGAIFPRFTNVSTRRGDDRIDAPNWFMGMYSHPLWNDAQFGAHLMMSLDPLTEGGRGYPLLFQSGESWNGEPLHDRQHPHDLFDELSFSISQKLHHDLSTYIYFGYPGEPALGPPTFMHRPSAMDDPDAPIGHHWQDSTHVTFGVATAGLVWRNVKIEGSIFTGREPDEDRYDFDQPDFDSYSGRISWNPTRNLALQVSFGYIKSPEAIDPELNRHRTTASAIYNLPLGHDSNWSNTFVWGQNNDTGEGKTQSFLVESNYQRGRDTVYFRWERVEKSGHELVLNEAADRRVFPVGAYTLGYVRDLSHGNGLDIGLGAQFTINNNPDTLDRYYGDDVGYAFEFFLRIRPSLHSHGTHEHAEHVAGMEK